MISIRRNQAISLLTFFCDFKRTRVKQFAHRVGGNLLEVNLGWDELRLMHAAPSNFPSLLVVV